MASSLSLPEDFKIVSATAGAVTANGGITCDTISLKNVHKAWIVCHFNQAVADATTVQPQAATAVAPTGLTPTTYAFKWWLNGSCAATDTLVRQVDATVGTLAATIAVHMMVIEIDPSEHMATHGKTFDCLGCIITSAQATDFVSALYYLQYRYQAATPPTAILD
jgi:hypothetical protein